MARIILDIQNNQCQNKTVYVVNEQVKIKKILLQKDTVFESLVTET
jgi:hypothetical protein